jgi:hypothetical protein
MPNINLCINYPLPNEENHSDNIEYSLDTFQKTVDNNLHSGIVTDEPKRPQYPQHSDDLDETEITIRQGNIHQGECHDYEVQLGPTVPQISVTFHY